MHPKYPLRPVFRFLLGAMLACGFYLCLVTAWLWPFLIVWSVRRRFWRRPPQQPYRVNAPPIIKAEATPPPLPPIIDEALGRADFSVDEGEDAFAA